MGVEVKGAGDGVVIADRGCNDGCGYRDHSGWGSGWGAVGGALVGGGFGAVTSRMANRKSSASSRTLLKTPRLLASIE
nr:MAG: hypothetical protein [Bacteriophage sp.]